MDKELMEIMVNMCLKVIDKQLLEEPIYERFLSNKEKYMSKKIRDILKSMPKKQRLEGIKEYLMSEKDNFEDN